jgi:hypothetical protein
MAAGNTAAEPVEPLMMSLHTKHAHGATDYCIMKLEIGTSWCSQNSKNCVEKLKQDHEKLKPTKPNCGSAVRFGQALPCFLITAHHLYASLS